MDIKNMALNIFQYDLDKNGRHTSITQLCLVSIKSLMPSKDKLSNRINYKRFSEELNLWRYYKLGTFNSVENILSDNLDNNIYFQEDPSIFFRIIPIAVGNTSFEIAENETIKNIIYTSGNLRTLFKGIVINRIMYSKSKEELIEDLKDYLINFGQKEFIKEYSDCYRVNIDSYPGNYKIEFEKEKIKLINLLNGLDSKDYSEIQEVLDLLLRGEESDGIAAIFRTSFKEYNLNEFFVNMNDYALKLRSGEIDPEALKINDYRLPDVFKFKEGDKFYHSLLNNCLVVSKEVRNDILTSVISTKTGAYKFEKRL